jgi:hypothetical protein
MTTNFDEFRLRVQEALRPFCTNKEIEEGVVNAKIEEIVEILYQGRSADKPVLPKPSTKHQPAYPVEYGRHDYQGITKLEWFAGMVSTSFGAANLNEKNARWCFDMAEAMVDESDRRRI